MSFSARGTNVLKFENEINGWLVYKYMPNQRNLDSTWHRSDVMQLFHGTGWYSVSMVCNKGSMLESWREEAGHGWRDKGARSVEGGGIRGRDQWKVEGRGGGIRGEIR